MIPPPPGAQLIFLKNCVKIGEKKTSEVLQFFLKIFCCGQARLIVLQAKTEKLTQNKGLTTFLQKKKNIDTVVPVSFITKSIKKSKAIRYLIK